MSDQPEKVGRTRISVTLTKPYLDALSRLVEGGFYLGRGEASHVGRAAAPLPTLWHGALQVLRRTPRAGQRGGGPP